MTVTRKVYFDFDKNGTWVDVSNYTRSVSGSIGRTDWKGRVSDVGQCTITLSNVDRRFTPNYAAGPYYGKLVPKVPVKVEVSDDQGTHRMLTMWTSDWEPSPDRYDSQTICVVTCVDRIGELQSADISLPIQEGQRADELIEKVLADAYESGVAGATVHLREVMNNDTITIGSRTYTFKTALTPADNEVALGSQPWGQATFPGILDAAVNLAAAINRDDRSGTDYAAGTDRNVQVTALGNMGIGVDESRMTSQKNLNDNSGATNYEALATSFSFGAGSFYPEMLNEPSTMTVQRVWLYLKKVGNPAGTLTLRLELPSGFTQPPSGTLEHTDAYATLSESSLLTSWGWYAFDFQSEFTFNSWSLPGVTAAHWLVLTTSRAASATNYVQWGLIDANYSPRMAYITKTAGAWNARVAQRPFVYAIGGKLELEATSHGAWANSIALGQTGGSIYLPSATLSGGANALVGSTSLETGSLTFDYAGDTWASGDTNVLTAIQEITDSEFGLFWVAKNGDLVFKNQKYYFTLPSTGYKMSFSDAHQGQSGRLTKDNLANRVTISYQPRAVAASSVVAKASKPLAITGSKLIRTPRWNKTRGIQNQAGEKTVIIPYVDQGTAEKVGAIDIVQPLTPVTDFSVYNSATTTGSNVTNSGFITFALALTGSGVQVHMRNSSAITLWVHNLQISGGALVKQNTSQEMVEDATSRAAYGLQAFEFTLPFPSSDIDSFAYTLATFWLNMMKDPRYVLDSVTFRGVEIVDGTSIFDVELGEMIVVSEYQTAISSYKMMVIGIDVQLPEDDTHSITFYLQRLDTLTFWVLDEPGFSELGSTTRPSI